jgi:hypothetical protein
MLDLLRAWVYPDSKLVEVSRRDDEVRDALRHVAGRMLHDVASLFGGRPGIQQNLASYAEKLQVALPLRLDPDYEILFPGRDALGDDWQEGEARLLEAATRLAGAWSAREPIWVARRIADLTREAVSVQSTYPDFSGTVCRLIAESTDRPIEWIRAMEDAGVFGGHVEPFLRRMIALEDPGWTSIARDFLERLEWAGVIIELILTSSAPPTDLLESILVRLNRRNEDLVRALAARGVVPEETLGRLLKHEHSAVASAAAVGEWLSAPKGTVRESLLGDWREAVLADSSGQRDEFWLIEILGADRELARRWLDIHLSPDRLFPAHADRVISAAVSSLGPSERGELLSRLPEQHRHGWLISLLVGDDLEIYRGLLAEPRWAQSHLDPLAWSPGSRPFEEEPELSQAWIGKAQLAMQARYSPEVVARARLDSPKGWSGEESVMWESWVGRFRPLEQHEDPLVRRMASEAIRIATDRRDHALRAEKHEAIFGR